MQANLRVVITHAIAAFIGATVSYALVPRTSDSTRSQTEEHETPRQEPPAAQSRHDPRRASATAPAAEVEPPECQPAADQRRHTVTLSALLDSYDDEPSSSSEPERLSVVALPFVDGWTEGVLDETSPLSVMQFSAMINNELCNERRSAAAQLIALHLASRVARRQEVRAGLTCVLARSASEDIVLWTTLDIWSAGGFGGDPALAAISDRARDERTLRRLADMPGLAI